MGVKSYQKPADGLCQSMKRWCIWTAWLGCRPKNILL